MSLDDGIVAAVVAGPDISALMLRLATLPPVGSDTSDAQATEMKLLREELEEAVEEEGLVSNMSPAISKIAADITKSARAKLLECETRCGRHQAPLPKTPVQADKLRAVAVEQHASWRCCADAKRVATQEEVNEAALAMQEARALLTKQEESLVAGHTLAQKRWDEANLAIDARWVERISVLQGLCAPASPAPSAVDSQLQQVILGLQEQIALIQGENRQLRFQLTAPAAPAPAEAMAQEEVDHRRAHAADVRVDTTPPPLADGAAAGGVAVAVGGADTAGANY